MIKKIGIITVIKPLYDELLLQNFPAYLESSDFLRLCNKLEITDEYTEAYNAAVEREKTSDYFLWSGKEINFQDFLADLLNKLFEKRKEQFADIVSYLLAGDLAIAKRHIQISGIVTDLDSLGQSVEKKQALLTAYSKYEANFLLKVELLKGIMLNRAVEGGGDDTKYRLLREAVLRNTQLKEYIPQFLIEHPELGPFRSYAQSFGGYALRREFINQGFNPLLKKLSSKNSSIAESIIIDNTYVDATWQKALIRMTCDPEGAITMARTMIETVCKHILDASGKDYDHSADLPVLYKTTTSLMNLSPDQHTQEIFKQILSGCFSVVQGLGTIRNKISDAHGISETRIRPSSRHAQLAINLSGSVCQFLLESYKSHQQKKF